MASVMHDIHNGIPISTSLEQDLSIDEDSREAYDKKRIVYMASCAVIIAALISILAKFLVYLINLITNISFHHLFSLESSSPGGHGLGLWVILIPATGGLIVGLMAFYGSKAIRGHGIPEAMEQILTNDSKIRPSITYLKPLSAAISIGTGGPFGAEGPIIATGGALGSTIGQILKISAYERKILLAAGATAGMSAIFGSPIAAIFLAIELLLFEFSPRSIIPVALACITGAAGHHLLFETGPVFPSPFIAVPGSVALAVYSCIGLVMGFLSAGVTRLVYFIEDAFEKIPIHWMWYPMIGGIVVGIVGYFAPMTLGVGYSNITELLSGTTPIKIVLSLCVLKFISWSVALGSGTSGGTLAPLLTIGGAAGALLGMAASMFFPHAEIVIPLAVLTGMSSMFAGASRALLTSIIFALETTGQSNALLPLLAACVASYVVSYLLMKNTIMTEKIARRGINTPHVYAPDILQQIRVKQVIKIDATRLQHASAIQKKHFGITMETSLRLAVEMMARENLEALPVLYPSGKKVAGVLTYRDVLSAYRMHLGEHEENRSISLKRRTLKMLVHGKKRISNFKNDKY
jgi:CIC family chloride channel protein